MNGVKLFTVCVVGAWTAALGYSWASTDSSNVEWLSEVMREFAGALAGALLAVAHGKAGGKE